MSKLIPLTGKYGTGKFAIVDDEDYDELMQYKWYLRNDYTIKRSIPLSNVRISMHRHIMKPENSEINVDHIDRNRLNNQKSNLRLCSNKENNLNKGKPTHIYNNRKNQDKSQKQPCSSKFKGVSWSDRDNGWVASIKQDGKNYYLGQFQNEIDAAEHYDYKAIELFGQFACLNFPNKNYTNFIIKSKKICKTSKYLGVFKSKLDNKFTAWHYIKRKKIYIGKFNNEIDAAYAVDYHRFLMGATDKFNFPEYLEVVKKLEMI